MTALQDANDTVDTVKRQQILDGARQCFLAQGFDGASMNDIARASFVLGQPIVCDLFDELGGPPGYQLAKGKSPAEAIRPALVGTGVERTAAVDSGTCEIGRAHV